MTMRTEGHWEPPEARKLLLTVHAFAELIDVPLTKAYSLSHVLERVYYGRGQNNFRVTVASVDAFRVFLEQGMTLEQARDAMVRRPEYQETQRQFGPAPQASVPPPSSSGRSRWWRNRRAWWRNR